MTDAPLLSVAGLRVDVPASARALVDEVAFEVGGGECVALVGESGSGKSLTARALLGLLRAPLRMRAERLRLGATDLLRCSPGQWNALRGARLALMLQDPRHSLNPVLTVGRQLRLALNLHSRLSAGEREARIAALLDAVGLTDRRRVLGACPHQLSGGMGQRVVLAMSLLHDPQVLIADEPTSALDADLRDQVLELILRQVRQRRMGLLLISHDLQQVARHADRALVMYRGRIVDRCTGAGLAHSGHPYTRALWACRPNGRSFGGELPVLDRAASWETA